MVQKAKGGKKSRSVVSGKKKKSGMKHERKMNYKKRVENEIECCVCYGMIPDRSDNTISCGRTNHPLCGDCKMKLLDMDNDCPMCRSHPIPQPKSQEIEMRVMKSKMLGEEKPVKKIKVIGTNWTSLDCIYKEVGKDKNKISIYKSAIGRYLYRSHGKYPDWVINDNYDPKTKKVFAYSGGKLLGTKEWNIIQKGGIWEEKYVGVYLYR